MLDTAEMITFTEKLIEEIKHYPVLYDKVAARGKDFEKEEAWVSLTERLPSDLKVTVDDTKKRWRTLKDCYSKYLRSGTTSNKYEARYKSWRWSGHMEYFKTYVLHTYHNGDESLFLRSTKKFRRLRDRARLENNRVKNRTEEHLKGEEFIKNDTVQPQIIDKNIKGEIDEDVLEEVDDESYQAVANAVSEYANTSSVGWDQEIDESDTRENLQNSSPKSIASVEHENFIDPLLGRSFDGIDLTFLGYASSIKKLTPRRQSLIKFAVAKLIMQEELAQQSENQTSSSYEGVVKNDISIERV
ncbi:PREDICTED: uncharacterized protein LOC108379034 [Rhagoletis zephyria]|uniref:uncharacterized protein LOC108371293 n=1 Tax=Rhagoletis zephyria TaxID=28612 RepID=UPI0008117F55|nr:PREDICTED: uncharacterized protein LOC108371293 [Rhagoletis zephyria]XP_017490838.1 PREDICTED: uncharacterized protein LOC108379034 [Rhagoletis zephyria]XP_036341018.1 uncharacterized protein LOC118750402 [Rhagoletis pomonella]